jgi:hypothetical protein
MERAGEAAVIDLPGAAALRSLRTGLGNSQVRLLPPDPPAPTPPPAPQAPVPAASTSARGSLRYGRWRLDGPTWELHAALAALRRDTLTGRDLRRHLAELDAQPQASAPPQARPQAQARPTGAGGEAGSAQG